MVSIKKIFPCIFTIQLIVTILLTGSIAYNSHKQMVINNAYKIMSQITHTIDEQLSIYFLTPPKLSQVYAYRLTYDRDINLSNLMEPNILREIQISMSVVSRLFGEEIYISLTNPQGQYINFKTYSSGKKFFYILDLKQDRKMRIYKFNPSDGIENIKLFKIEDTNFDPRQRPFYQEAVEAGKPTWSTVYFSFQEKLPLIGALYPIYDDKGQFLAVVSTSVNIEKISEYFADLNLTDSAVMFMFDPAGNMLANSIKEPISYQDSQGNWQLRKIFDTNNPLIQSTVAYLKKHPETFTSATTEAIYLKEHGQGEFIQLGDLKRFGLDWKIAIVIPEKYLLNQLDDIVNNTIKLALILLIFTLIVGIVTAKWFIRPIITLSFVASAVEKDELTDNQHLKQLEKDSLRQDEFGKLARSFQRMIEEIKVRTNKLKAEIEQLIVEIDHQKKEEDVKEIIDSEFFQNLKAKSNNIRQQRKRNPKS